MANEGSSSLAGEFNHSNARENMVIVHKQLFSTADSFRSPDADCLGCCANIDSVQYRKLDNSAAAGFCPMQIAMKGNGKPTHSNP
ncbi:hypothetical protein CSIM01_06610 [Colletotrichum simmondsii]|uniref:Uncharacterized protein n=1 Tax=Colletotrichum simmondsii TaxID=703756 RepID=A0A135SVE9_9PEZI|nr:hypothetical protein CSIM01_06610 [Colletotrichum simmondsii]